MVLLNDVGLGLTTAELISGRAEAHESGRGAPARWLVCASIHQELFAVNFLKELVRGYMTSEKTA